MKKLKIYLDTCCFNRPFDDQTREKIQLETHAVLFIFKHSELDNIDIIGSEILEYEISKIADNSRRWNVSLLYKMIHERILLNKSIEERAKEITKIGFSNYDSLHIASAEHYKLDVLLTTDRIMVNLYLKNTSEIKIKIINPLKWVEEELIYEQ